MITTSMRTAFERARDAVQMLDPKPKQPTPEEIELNRITGEIIKAAVAVHKRLGPGLLESVYEACLVHELEKAAVKVRRQLPVKITYDELQFDEAYRLDLLVEDKVIVELKSTTRVADIHKAQLLTYIKLANKHIGLLVTFNTKLLTRGVTRMIL